MNELQMKELYAIMRELLEVAYHQKSLLYLMEKLEAAYDGEEQEAEGLAVGGVRYYLAVLHRELEDVISRLDVYMAEQARKQ